MRTVLVECVGSRIRITTQRAGEATSYKQHELLQQDAARRENVTQITLDRDIGAAPKPPLRRAILTLGARARTNFGDDSGASDSFIAYCVLFDLEKL